MTWDWTPETLASLKDGSSSSYTIETDASAGGGLIAGYGGHHGRPAGRDHLEFDGYPLDGSVTQRTPGTSLTDRLATFDGNGTAGPGIFEFALTRSRSYTYRPTLPCCRQRRMFM